MAEFIGMGIEPAKRQLKKRIINKGASLWLAPPPQENGRLRDAGTSRKQAGSLFAFFRPAAVTMKRLLLITGCFLATTSATCRAQPSQSSRSATPDFEFPALTRQQMLEPDADSLKLECTIFVLSENLYSSAGSLMNICRQSRQLVSVGLPNNTILGLGIDPFAFSLPNSKIVFWIEPVVDLTDARNAKDTHHNDVEVRVRPTIEQLLDYYGTGDDMPMEERLTKHDPFFKRVLEMD